MSNLVDVTSRTAANDHCTCAEAAGENPECALHGVDTIVRKLRSFNCNSRKDVDTVYSAADLLESLWDDARRSRSKP